MATGIKIHENTPDDALIPLRKSREGECVTIFFAPLKLGEVRDFRCLDCGRLLFQYEFSVSLIVVSPDTPRDKGSVNVQCPRCKLMHRLLW